MVYVLEAPDYFIFFFVFSRKMDVYLKLPSDIQCIVEKMAFGHSLPHTQRQNADYLDNAVKWLSKFRDHLCMFQVELQIALNKTVWKTYHFSPQNAVQTCLIVDDPVYSTNGFRHAFLYTPRTPYTKQVLVGVHKKSRWLLFTVRRPSP